MRINRLQTILAMFLAVPGIILADTARNRADVTSAGGTATPFYYMYQGEPIYLSLDVKRLAVRFDAKASGAGRSAALSDVGLTITASETTGVERWRLLEMETPIRDAGETDSQLSKLLESPAIEFASPVFEQPGGGWMIVTPDVLIRFRPSVGAAGQTVLSSLAGRAEVVEENFGGMAGAYRLRGISRNGLEVLALANELAADSRLEWAEPDMQATVRKLLTPNDPGWPNLWGLNNSGQSGGTPDMDMDCDLAWDISTGSEDVLVLILDDGVELYHPDLNIAQGADFTGQGSSGWPANECDNHGTAVAGCVSAIVNNSLGTIGAAPGCRVLSAKYSISNVPCDNSGTYQFSWLVNALNWGENQGARVSNNSSGLSSSSSITSKYSSTYSNGMVHFASAGNSGTEYIDYPASLSFVNAISALNRYGNLASFSSFGSGLSLVAPGQSIYTTDRQGSAGYDPGNYVYADGTSFSSPYAAAVAALLLSVDPWLTAGEVEDQLHNTATDLGTAGHDIYYGYGLVNAHEAIQHAAFDISADVTLGVAPLTVNFEGSTARPATGWDWDFGDEGTSDLEDPTHEYVQPGSQTVEATIHTADRDYTKVVEGMISVYADTIDVEESTFDGTVGRVDIYVRNYLPLTEILIPFTWDGPIDIDYDDDATTNEGLRSSDMTLTLISIVPAWNAATLYLDATSGPPLEPGSGPVVSLYFNLNEPGATGSVPIQLWDYAIYDLSFACEAGYYVPVAYDGSIKISCCQGTVGDANGIGGNKPTIGDITTMIDAKFVTGTCEGVIDCILEADVNQSGGSNPTCHDVTIGDITTLIDYLFVTGEDNMDLLDCL